MNLDANTLNKMLAIQTQQYEKIMIHHYSGNASLVYHLNSINIIHLVHSFIQQVY